VIWLLTSASDGDNAVEWLKIDLGMLDFHKKRWFRGW